MGPLADIFLKFTPPLTRSSLMSLLLIHDVPIECINRAAIRYAVPAKVIISVLAIEGGEKGTVHSNQNGTEDLGPMQINSTWLPQFERFQITREDLINNPCLNVNVGAWILSQKIKEGKYYWQGVAGYHSFTPQLNANYKNKLIENYNFLEEVLNR